MTEPERDDFGESPSYRAPAERDDRRELERRLATLEERTRHLATDADIQRVKLWVATSVIGGLLGIASLVIAAIVALDRVLGS